MVWSPPQKEAWKRRQASNEKNKGDVLRLETKQRKLATLISSHKKEIGVTGVDARIMTCNIQKLKECKSRSAELYRQIRQFEEARSFLRAECDKTSAKTAEDDYCLLLGENAKKQLESRQHRIDVLKRQDRSRDIAQANIDHRDNQEEQILTTSVLNSAVSITQSATGSEEEEKEEEKEEKESNQSSSHIEPLFAV